MIKKGKVKKVHFTKQIEGTIVNNVRLKNISKDLIL